MDKFATLHTDIQSDAIPTCVCEKSLEDKMEKECLKCAQNLGGIVAPSLGVLGGIAEGALSVWKPVALAAAKKAAIAEGLAAGEAAGIEAGKNAVIGALKEHFFIKELGIGQLDSFFTTKYYFDIENLATVILNRRGVVCGVGPKTLVGDTCDKIATNLGLILPGNRRAPPGTVPIVQRLKFFAGKAEQAAAHVTNTTTEKVTAELTTEKTGEIAATYMGYQTTIIASIFAIVVIVLIMVHNKGNHKIPTPHTPKIPTTSNRFNYGYNIFDFTLSTKKKNEEKTPIHKTIRRIDVMYLVFFDVGRMNNNVAHVYMYIYIILHIKCHITKYNKEICDVNNNNNNN
ncbi:surface antigen [Plasmodium falciparum UGT5.1]|uniref:Surface antigen n=1 Tax=Plasmodium falciparum UGT5.1 TaxID=1237627 RepID=W7JCK6_PLAFA|nr:surface antigen [Plasmodium falciparum UGT5.1]